MEIIGGSLTKNSLGAMKVAGSTAPGRRGGTSDRYIVVVFFVWGGTYSLHCCSFLWLNHFYS